MNKKSLIRGMAFLSGTAVGITAFTWSAAELLMGMAFDRKMPKLAKGISGLISGSSGMRDIHSMQKAGAEELRKLEFETVTISGFDGIKLVGHLHRCPEPRRMIIAFHGWRSSWDMDFGLIAPLWMEQNCSFLIVEQRGQNESGGDYMGFGLLERFDCLSWVQWTDAQNFGVPIYLSGISMGATTVLMAAGMGLPDSVHGISADCAFTSPHAIWKHVAQDNLRIRYSRGREQLIDRICREKIGMDSDDYSTLEAMKTCKTPILFVHGEKDHFVPPEMTRQNFEACTAPKRMVLVKNADHGMSYLVDKAECEKELLNFWETFD